MEIVWRPSAIEDINSAWRYIARENPTAAERFYTRVVSAVEGLADNPNIGRPGRVLNTREFVVPRTRYVVAYTLIEDRLVVLAVQHGARRWPVSF